MNKLVINRLGKLFVTNDACAILRELEVQHPRAFRVLGEAAEKMNKQIDDYSCEAILVAAALLKNALPLLDMVSYI
jgi:T-complex protein 1 subunit theta